MISINKIKEVFKLYDYDLLQESDDYLVYSVGHNLYPGVEIVSFIEKDSEIIKKLVEEYRAENYSVRVCSSEEADSIEEYLFNWFFQVELSNKKIKLNYAEYTDAVMKAYGINNIHYEYITCPYSIERNNLPDKNFQDKSIIDSLRRDIDGTGVKFIIVEAPAGYGKTSTAMELLYSYADVTQGIRPFFMSLSKDRIAPTFYYLLVSQINKSFNVILGDRLVIHNIKAGRIPLIIDGFDELLSEDLDRGNVAKASRKGLTMLSTIAELLHGNAKIVLTTRKTAILSGQEFLDWYQQSFHDSKEVEFIRYRLELPRIDNWLKKRRVAQLSSHIADLSNPVLLGYLHYLSDEEFSRQCKSDSLIEHYVEKLLTREIERQQLPFTVKEQILVFERLASAFAYEDITADTRSNVKDSILLMSSDMIQHYETPTKDALSLANTLTNHALLDRKGDSTIGFVNDFVLGVFLGYALIDDRDETLKDYYCTMSSKFIEKVILSMAASDKDKRELTWLQMQERCSQMTDELRFLADVKLLHQTASNYNDAYFDGYQVTDSIIGNDTSTFSGCHFVNIEFRDGLVNFNNLENCTFINCVFNGTVFLGETNDSEFYECTKDGMVYSNVVENTTGVDISDIELTDDDKMKEMLGHYILVGGQGRKMQLISVLKRSYGDSHDFKKVFSSLCNKKYVVTNGDKSHITTLGLDFLRSYK